MIHIFRMRWTKVLMILSTIGFIGCSNQTSENIEPEASSTELTSHAHATTDETCFICDASKREAGRLWCSEHGRYEDRCWICQPQLEDKARAYCKEHFLYEDECFLCHPELKNENEDMETTPEESAKVSIPKTLHNELFCNEHNLPERECGICQPQLAGALESGNELKVRFESKLSSEKAGIQTVKARSIQTQASVQAVCEVSYNENKLAKITPLASGIVKRVLVDLGTKVNTGDVLVEIHSTEVAKAKAAYISAAVDAELKEIACKREEGLVRKKISSERDFQEADAACKMAKLTESTTLQSLQNFGFTSTEIANIKNKQETSAVLFVRAPFSGTLVERQAVVGEAMQPGNNLFVLSDLSNMWLSLSIPADRSAIVKQGLKIKATFSGAPSATTTGELTWLSPSIDERSRMIKGRAVVDNKNRQLRAGMFGDVQILLSAEHSAIGVPKGAIQHHENNPFVFVKLEDDLFSLRRVVVEPSSGNHVAVLSGLQKNEPVVVNGAFTVMSEFLKSRLGAGCVDD